MSDQNFKKQDGELRLRLRELMAALELQLAPGNRIESNRRADAGPPAASNPGRRPPKTHNPVHRPGGGKKARRPAR
jgi:hypothetical protein